MLTGATQMVTMQVQQIAKQLTKIITMNKKGKYPETLETLQKPQKKVELKKNYPKT